MQHATVVPASHSSPPSCQHQSTLPHEQTEHRWEHDLFVPSDRPKYPRRQNRRPPKATSGQSQESKATRNSSLNINKRYSSQRVPTNPQAVGMTVIYQSYFLLDPAAPTPYGYPVVHTAYGYDAYGYPIYYYDGGPFPSTTESYPAVGISAIPHFNNARAKNYSQPQLPADALPVVPTSSSTHSDAKSNLPAVQLHSTRESSPRKSFDRAATRKRKPKSESLVWVVKTSATKGNERSSAGMEGEQLN